MIIDISDFLSNDNDKFHEYSGSINVELDYGQTNLTEDPKYKLFMSKVQDDIILDMDLEFNYEKPCDRCLEISKLKEKIKYTAKVVTEDQYNNVDDEELDLVLLKEKNKLDLSELIRELVILSIPMKTLCSEDCKGICIKCGSNLNLSECDCENEEIDIRFASLKGMFDQEEV